MLLLDEPSSGLDEDETEALGRLLLELAGNGLGVLLVEHDMPFVMGTCALHQRARLRAHHRPAATPRDPGDPEVQRAYLGTTAGKAS